MEGGRKRGKKVKEGWEEIGERERQKGGKKEKRRGEKEKGGGRRRPWDRRRSFWRLHGSVCVYYVTSSQRFD